MFKELLVAHDALGFLHEEDLEEEFGSPRQQLQFRKEPPSRSPVPQTDIFAQMEQMQRNVAVYPKSREEAGPAFWSVLHHHAAAFPKKPSPAKRKRTRIFLKEWLKAFPCESCRADAEQFVRVSRPKLRNKKTYAQWTADFHNFVNRKTGKPFVRLEIAEGAHDSCSTCMLRKAHDTTTKGFTPEEKAELHSANVEGVEKYFDRIKEASKKVLWELADKTGVPRPNIVFSACPEAPYGSCTIASIGDGGSNNATIFLNPEQFSPRTLAHEFYHFHRAMKGDSKDFANEKEAEEFAMKVLNEHFEFDDSTKAQTPTPVAHDTRVRRVAHQDQQPAFVDNFDFIFEPFAGIGATAKQLNNAHMPEILGYSINAIEGMALSPLGMVMTNFLSGLAMTGIAILSGQDDLSIRDRQFLLELGAHQLWSFLPYITANQAVVSGAARVGEALQRGDFGDAVSAFVKGGAISPQPLSQSQTTTTTTTQQQQVAQKAAATDAPLPSYATRRFSI